jgi:hypothetical protein
VGEAEGVEGGVETGGDQRRPEVVGYGDGALGVVSLEGDLDVVAGLPVDRRSDVLADADAPRRHPRGRRRRRRPCPRP